MAVESRTLSKLLPVVTLLLFAALAAADDKREADCAKVKAQIRKLESRMRRGYTAAQGVKLDARMRELKDRRYRVCR